IIEPVEQDCAAVDLLLFERPARKVVADAIEEVVAMHGHGASSSAGGRCFACSSACGLGCGTESSSSPDSCVCGGGAGWVGTGSPPRPPRARAPPSLFAHR